MANLRRLKDISAIEIKPITILVGRNSSGKSSYLRALPLLRQSALTRTSSPILWYGDFVDFGSYEGAVSDNDLSNKMTFRFSVDNLPKELRRYYGGGSLISYPTARSNNSADCDIVLRASKDSAQICSIIIKSHEYQKTYDIAVDNSNNISSIKMDGDDVLKYFEGIKFIMQQGAIFPTIYAVSEKSVPMTAPGIAHELSAASSYLANKVKLSLDKRIKQEAVVELCASLLIENIISKESLSNYAEKASSKSWGKLLKDVSEKDGKKLYDTIVTLHSALQITSLMRGVSERLREIIAGVLYIGPARARSERYYRYQDLAVSEIDPDGKNFPMFLNSLNYGQFRNLSSWVEDLFNYKLDLSKSSGHISINVVEGKSVTNVVDTGYGVSQILPVLGQIWWAMNKPRDPRRPRAYSNDRILVIEQPELHLHPAHQAFLADAFVDANIRFRSNSKNSGKLNFVIETHSETLVNRLGQLISKGKISSDDVQIILFEPSEEEDRQTDIRISRFGEEGQLIDWPYGFFQPSV